MTEKLVVFGVLFLSLTSLPLLYFINNSKILKNDLQTMGAMFGCYAGVLLGAVALFNRFFRNVEPFIYAICLFCWTSVCSLCFALQVDGFIGNVLTSFLAKGEPYMKTAHGVMTSYWDGSVHLLLCVAIIIQYIRRESHREISLILCGSMVTNAFVLFYGSLCGPHNISWLSLLRFVVYLIIPVLAGVYHLHKKPIQARTFLHFPTIWKRPVDSLFGIFFVFAMIVVCFRGLAVLGADVSCMKDYMKTVEPYMKDPSGFPKIQIIMADMVLGCYYAFAIYGLYFPGQHWMSDWSLLNAGAAAQAQFCYIGGALHRFTSKSMHPPKSGQAAIMFWSVNVILLVLPIMFAYWCQRDAEKNGRSYTATLSQPIETKSVRRVTRVEYSSEYKSE